MTKQELNSTIEIRKIKPQEINQLVKLCKAHADYEGASFDEFGKENLLTQSLFDRSIGLQCWVAAQDSEILGYITFIKQFSTWDAAYYLYMDCLYLKPEARGRNIGHMLIGKAKNHALQNGYKEMQWQTPVENDGAIRFYKRMGAEHKKKERFFMNQKLF